MQPSNTEVKALFVIVRINNSILLYVTNMSENKYFCPICGAKALEGIIEDPIIEYDNEDFGVENVMESAGEVYEYTYRNKCGFVYASDIIPSLHMVVTFHSDNLHFYAVYLTVIIIIACVSSIINFAFSSYISQEVFSLIYCVHIQCEVYLPLALYTSNHLLFP